VATRQMRAIWHPTRARIIELLTAGPKTQSQLVEAFGGCRRQIAYHTRVLCRTGCIRLAESSGPDSDDPLYEVS
jgi:hypothetical protein